jgi:protein-S-isoprenylcysteine O-methyltransferase Ste14
MFAAGIVMQRFAPLTMDSPTVVVASHIFGIALVLGGGALALATLRRHAPSALVTSGPYRLTRNPMYVGLTLTYIGAAATEAQIWPLLLLPLLELYLHFKIIPVEEAKLRQIFGSAYERYCIGVPRWI